MAPQVSTSSPTTSGSTAVVSNNRESVGDFVRWGIAQLALGYNEDHGVGRLQLDPADQSTFDGQTVLNLALADSANHAPLEPIDLDSRFGKWLVEQLRGKGLKLHARPRRQPTAVKDISARLFPAYQVEGGRVHLGGCQLNDYPFLRLTFATDGEGSSCVQHLFVGHDGTTVSEKLACELGLQDVEPILQWPPRIEDEAFKALIAAGRRMSAKALSERDPTAASPDPLVVTLVWVKHAEGKLHFTVGDQTEALPFSGWARLIAPQPFVAPNSGASTFHLSTTDDGRIDAYEQIVRCDHSGRRVLNQELVSCCVTGKRVLDEFTEICPVTSKPALTEQFSECPQCLQKVSKTALDDNICVACRNLTRIPSDDPRLVWIVGEHPGLVRWKIWRLSETQSAYILQAENLLKRLLVVADKENLGITHMAVRSKFSAKWTPVLAESRADLLL